MTKEEQDDIVMSAVQLLRFAEDPETSGLRRPSGQDDGERHTYMQQKAATT
jgi:hypothetical protein